MNSIHPPKPGPTICRLHLANFPGFAPWSTNEIKESQTKLLPPLSHKALLILRVSIAHMSWDHIVGQLHDDFLRRKIVTTRATVNHKLRWLKGQYIVVFVFVRS